MALFLQRVQTVGSSLISSMVKYLELSAQHLKYFYNQISGAKKSSSTSHILFSRLSSFTDFLSRCKSPGVLLKIIGGGVSSRNLVPRKPGKSALWTRLVARFSKSRPTNVIFHTPFQTCPSGRNYVIIS